MGGMSVLILMGILSFIFYAIVACFFIIVIYIAISYAFESIALMNMSKNLNYKAPVTSYIPIYNKYVLGKVANNKALGLILMVDNIIILTLGLITYFYYNSWAFLAFLVCILISFILNIILSDKIFRDVLKKYSVICTIFSVLTLGFLRPIFLFAISYKKPNMNN